MRARTAPTSTPRVISFLLLAPDFARVLHCVRGTDTIPTQLEAGAPSAPAASSGSDSRRARVSGPGGAAPSANTACSTRAQAGIWEVAEGVESFFAAGPQPQRHIFGSV
jgi:hypothetical protein